MDSLKVNPELLKDFVALFLEKLSITIDSVSVSSNPRTTVSVVSPQGVDLVGKNGENLQAINTLVKRMIEKKYGAESASVLVDINRYHEDKIDRVRASAQELAAKARLSMRDIEMEPMSSYERLVVHELFVEDPTITTASEGEGALRHIVLKYIA